ncbi:MAG: hypothetical protein HS116_18535 [Planctomycetes bacterium]|nr:hypothetical protein [Planctomycetota bacterium]
MGNLTPTVAKGKTLFENLSSAFRLHDDASDHKTAGLYDHLAIEFSATEADEWASFLMHLRDMALEGSQALEVRNESGGALPAGTLVYVSGYGSGKWLISPADNGDLATRAQYVLADEIADDADGIAYAYKTVGDLDTSGTAAHDPVYLDAAGAFTFTEPTPPDQIQIVGYVEVVDATEGIIRFTVGGEAAGGGGVVGGGTTDYHAKWTGSGELGDSILSDDGTLATLEGSLLIDTGDLDLDAGDLELTLGDLRLAAGTLEFGSGAFAAVDNGAADANGPDFYFHAGDGGAHTSNNPRGGDWIVKLGSAGSGGAGRTGRFCIEEPGAGTDQLFAYHNSTDGYFETSAGDLVLVPAGGEVIIRQPGGVAGTDDIRIYHDGSNGRITSESGTLGLSVPDGSVRLNISNSSITSFLPIIASGANARDLGNSSGEWRGLYLGEDASSGMYLGLDQDWRLFYDETTTDCLILAEGAVNALAIKGSAISSFTAAAATAGNDLFLGTQAGGTASGAGVDGGDVTLTTGAGSAAAASSGLAGGNGGDLTLTLGAGGAGDGAGAAGRQGRLTVNGDLYLGDNTLSRPFILDYAEAVNAIGSIGGGTQDIDLTLGNVVTGTVDTSTTTFTFSNPPASGRAGSFTLILTNGGSQTVNWPASVDWEGGVAPTLTAAGVDVLCFTTVNAGTTWYGFVAGLDMQ